MSISWQDEYDMEHTTEGYHHLSIGMHTSSFEGQNAHFNKELVIKNLCSPRSLQEERSQKSEQAGASAGV